MAAGCFSIGPTTQLRNEPTNPSIHQRYVARRSLSENSRKLKLTVNEDKTRICKIPEGEFDFLGFTFGRMYYPTTGQARFALRPSKKSIQRMVETVHALTVRARTWQETAELVDKLNRVPHRGALSRAPRGRAEVSWDMAKGIGYGGLIGPISISALG